MDWNLVMPPIYRHSGDQENLDREEGIDSSIRDMDWLGVIIVIRCGARVNAEIKVKRS